MNTLEIFQALKADAKKLLFDDLDAEFITRYNIKEAIPSSEGLYIIFNGASLGFTMDTTTTLYRDDNSYAKLSGYGIPHHERRLYLFDLARSIMHIMPEWMFNPNAFDIAELRFSNLDLDLINASENKTKYISAISENLSQINSAIEFFTQCTHTCPLARLSPSPSASDIEVAEDCTYKVHETDGAGDALSWKCTNHDIKLEIVGKSGWRKGKFTYQVECLGAIEDPRINQSVIDDINDKYSTYLRTLDHLNVQLPSSFDIDDLKPLKVLRNIDLQLQQDPTFFDFLKPTSNGVFSPDLEDARNRALKPEVAEAEEVSHIDKMLKKHEVADKVDSSKVCQCSIETVFAKGCQCSRK